MSRAWRIEYAGALYHLLSRGNERCDIFTDERDRHSFLDSIEEMSQRFELDVFAYVLMSNQPPFTQNPPGESEKSDALVWDDLHPALQPAAFQKRAFVSRSLQKHYRAK